jgi:hypothetical protein
VLWEVQNVEKSDKKWGSKNFDFVANLNIGRTSFEPKNKTSQNVNESQAIYVQDILVATKVVYFSLNMKIGFFGKR